jgi:hypothetical protein
MDQLKVQVQPHKINSCDRFSHTKLMVVAGPRMTKTYNRVNLKSLNNFGDVLALYAHALIKRQKSEGMPQSFMSLEIGESSGCIMDLK